MGKLAAWGHHWGKLAAFPPLPHRLVLEPQGAGTGVLTVAGADYWDQGRLRCQAHTELDVVEAEAMLRVVGESPNTDLLPTGWEARP